MRRASADTAVAKGKAACGRHRIRDYVDDVAAVAVALPAPPILVGHSMGGFVVQKRLEKQSSPAAFLLASVPPTGAWSIFRRLIRHRPLDVLKGNATLSLYAIVSDPAKAHQLLFPASMPQDEVNLHHRRLQDESALSWLDCLALDLVDMERIASPVAVYGAAVDAIVGFEEVMATASLYKVRPFVFENVAHDMMLDPRWPRRGALPAKRGSRKRIEGFRDRNGGGLEPVSKAVPHPEPPLRNAKKASKDAPGGVERRPLERPSRPPRIKSGDRGASGRGHRLLGQARSLCALLPTPQQEFGPEEPGPS